MTEIKKHIAFKTLTLVLVMALLVPSAIKFAHVFKHHEHIVCHDKVTTHIHKVDFECELCKFNISQTYFHTTQNFEFLETPSFSHLFFELYNFKYYHQQLPFSLRGPPELLA